MPRDSQGNCTQPFNWEQDAANEIGIEADRHQENDDDHLQMLTQSLDRQGRGGMQADLALGNFKITQLNEGTAASDALNIGQAQVEAYQIGTDTGTANTYQITLNPPPTAYTTGLTVKFVAQNANTGASTLQVGALTPAPPLQIVGKDLFGGEIQDGAVILAVYTGSAFEITSGAVFPGGRIVYSTAGSFTFTKATDIPAWVTQIKVTTVGAGSGGSGADATGAEEASSGGGGPGGGWESEILQVASLNATETVTVGAKGIGSASAAIPPTGGGTSSFGTSPYLSATGGSVPASLVASSNTRGRTGALGGQGTGGDKGGRGFPGGGAYRDGTNNSANGGQGGGSILGGGPPETWASGNSVSGSNAASPGAGGSGAANGNAQAAAPGGDGADGVVIIKW